MNVKGGGITLYCKTRWTTAARSVNDVIRLKIILEDVRIYKIKLIISSI